MDGAAVKLPGPDYPAPAKLNLFLHVVGRREDGYHLLQSILTFIDYGDRLRFRKRNDGIIGRVNDLAGVAPGSDLALRAAKILQQETGIHFGADIELEKRIPIGGGLGGGSSDAATTLIVLNHLWETGLTRAELQAIGLRLGADVPFFIFGQSAFAEGVGEKLHPIDLPQLWYLVLTPPVTVVTAQVFSHPNLTTDTNPLKISDFSAVELLPLLKYQKNDLEPVVGATFPEVASYLNALSVVSQDSIFAAGERNARMTGSGACVFAAFENETAALMAKRRLPDTLLGFIAEGLNRHPLFTLSR
jgi:4-diphosphocytidyl-2-C-methyl-D-erythritol kinase